MFWLFFKAGQCLWESSQAEANITCCISSWTTLPSLTIAAMDLRLFAASCVFKVIRITFHSLEVTPALEVNHWVRSDSMGSLLQYLIAPQETRQQEMNFKGVSAGKLGETIVFSGPSLSSRCLWFGISSGQRIAMETLNRKHSIPCYSMCFCPEKPKRSCWVFWAAEDCRLVFHLERQTSKTAGGAALVGGLLSWDKNLCSLLPAWISWRGRGKHPLRYFNCPHMSSGY